MSDGPVILGLLYEGGDPSAALLINGELSALAEEERFSRQKHALNVFPRHAVDFCLAHAGIRLDDVDIIAVGWDAGKFPDYMAAAYDSIAKANAPVSSAAISWQRKNLYRYTPEALTLQIEKHLAPSLSGGPLPPVKFVPHHYSHACSAYMLSGFKEACVITADGHGEEDCVHLWDADESGIRSIRQWNLPQSLGWYYTKFTNFFGFRPHDGEGKLMGLAAYGEYDPYWDKRVGQVLRLTADQRCFEVASRFFMGDTAPGSAFTAEWLALFGPPLGRNDPRLVEPYYRNLAWAVQDRLEKAGAALMKEAMRITGKKNVCVAGGVFMNCKMNGEMARLAGPGRFFAMPLAGDNGISLGAALAANELMNGPRTGPLEHLYYGPEFANQEISRALDVAGLRSELHDDISTAAARLLADSKIVAWFQGRMEAGARALGNRSILGNPLDPRSRDIINARVKFRELWRPFCPSTTETESPKYFECSSDLPFMIVACEARAGVAAIMPSVVHCDNTVRVQTVSRTHNPRYHALINAFKDITGIGVVLNTSFNVQDEPIVCSPGDAVRTFLASDIDALAIGDYLVHKAGL